MRGLLWIPLLGVLIGLAGCQYSRSYCRGPAVAGPVMVNRAPVRPCPGECQPSTFVPAPLPAGPAQPMPRGPGPGFENPPGRMPTTLPDLPGPSGNNRIMPPGLGQPIYPPPGASNRTDPWRASPDTRNSLPEAAPGPVPGPTPGMNPILPPEGPRVDNPGPQFPPRVQFGTPFPTPPGPGSEFAPILPETNPAPARNPSPSPAPQQTPIVPSEEKPAPILPPEQDPLRGPTAQARPAPVPMRIPEPPLAIPELKNAPPEVPQRPQETPSPIDIPGFTQVNPQVAVGQQPFLDGVIWLQKQGYRTVIHLRLPGTNDDAARRLFEGKGLRYQSIEVSPQTVTRETLDRLQRILKDEANHPVFVYDRDGYLVGGLWYLKLRLNDMMDSSRALEEAQRLGLNPELDANHRAMWNAVRTLGER